MNLHKFNSEVRRSALRRTALAMAVVAGVGMTGQVLAQATTGSVFGTAPVSSGETVRIINNQTGLTREVAVDSAGRFGANQLPVGDYTVSLMQSGNVIATHSHVTVSVNGGSQVPFTAVEAGKNVQNLSSITVTANAMPAIDVSSTRETSVITSQDLKTLPVSKSAEAIALLAPGTAYGASALGGGPGGAPLISFGGNSAVENAYYINGFNTTDPVGNAGGIALPYFAIAEQQTITSGYSAEYGRSTGGVISQVGQRGGNDFHAGAYVSWEPSWATSDSSNIYYRNPLSTNAGQRYGDIYYNRSNDSSWEQVFGAYLSGPLIKDKLFFFITAEGQHDNSKTTGAVTGPYLYSHSTSSPKFYGKLDWNINDSNILELTGIQTKIQDTSDNIYDYDYSTNRVGAFNSIHNPLASNKFKIGILKYTSYITDNLTLTALYGKMKSTYEIQNEPYPGFDPTIAGVLNVGNQNPAAPGYGNNNTYPTTAPGPGHKSTQGNFRLDLDWKLGDHDLKFGIDNVRSIDINDTTVSAGPGYYWNYGQEPSLDPSQPLVTGSGAGGGSVPNTLNYPNGQTGYFVDKITYANGGSFTVQQKAQYIEDNWQVTPNIVLNIGLRNDQFTNYDANSQPYIRETSPQWAPRLGFSWDIFGDSSAKLFANAGRYYLALPSGLGSRVASASTYIDQYYTYASIDSNGIPQGLTRIPATVDPFSADGEIGAARDPKTLAASDLKPEYQDEFVLGFQKMFNAFGLPLVWTTQATYSRMSDIVDDTCAVDKPTDADPALFNGCILVNPGRTNAVRYKKLDGTYGTYQWNPATATGATSVVGFPAAFRKYYSLEESLEHPWDGKWMGKIDYVFSKSYGTTEGPTDSVLGQISSAQPGGGGQSGSTTEAWDYPELMQYSNGELPNSHRHTLKAFGTYAITPEWLVSGIYTIQSGAPITCLGFWGPAQFDAGYHQAYHWCGGVPSRPGDAGNTPWIHQLNLSVNYIPAWAGKHLTLQVQIHNVFNEQNVTQYYSRYGSTAVGSTPNARYLTPSGLVPVPLGQESPRYVQLSAKYDW